jgi:UDP-sugar pyrophosphorylase
MPEFVNPKYKDNSKTTLKKATRLECLMQDFPKVLKNTTTTTTINNSNNATNTSTATSKFKSTSKYPANTSPQQQQQDHQQQQQDHQQQQQQRVGFTCVSADFCFSPVKNATAEGAALQDKGIHAGTVATGEADLYASYVRILSCIGCQVDGSSSGAATEMEKYRGISIMPGPAILLKPNFCCSLSEYKQKFPHPEKVQISARSTLVVRGAGVVIESLKLDGCLIIDCDDGMSMTINREVTNKGWMRVHDEDSDNEVVRMRGYRLVRLEQELVEVDQSTCVII